MLALLINMDSVVVRRPAWQSHDGRRTTTESS